MENCSISTYERSLDLQKAALKRSFTWNTRNGAILEVCVERFISLSEKNLSVQSVCVKIKSSSGTLSIEAGLDANVVTNGYNILGEVCTVKGEEIKNWQIKSTDSKITYSAEKKVSSGESIAVLKLVSVSTDRDLSYLQKDTPTINYNDIKYRCEDVLKKSPLKPMINSFLSITKSGRKNGNPAMC